MRSVLAASLLCASLLSGCGETQEPGPAGDAQASGEELYIDNCARCHGRDLRGTRTGPPFLDPVYAPDHHPDASFYSAVENGVQAHHWEFGPMPPIPGLDRDEVAAIISYVRSVQEEEGLE